MTQTRPSRPACPRSRGDRTERRTDLLTALLACAFVTVVAVIGTAIEESDHSLYVDWPPLYAAWLPHLGPGTPLALTLAVLVVAYGPPLAARLPWLFLTWGAWLTAMAWTWSLALIDGWHRGVAGRLVAKHEYLLAVDRFEDIGQTLRTFTQHILLTQPDNWPAHVAGHPPAAVLSFVGLDRIGLGGGAWAGVWCITAGSSVVAAVLIALRALTDERTARRAAPFLVLAPAAVWVGASADGYFMAVAAWGLALLALAATRTRAQRATALASGLLLGLTFYLSYGLTLMAIMAAAILLCSRTARPLPYALSGAALVAGAFTLAGFWWWEGYQLLVERYYQGVAADRPYSYWIWGNLANAVIITGLAAAAGLRRALASSATAIRRLHAGNSGARDVLVALVAAALCTIVAADLSGMSKAETERIWLPFTPWLLISAALLPRTTDRCWLSAQAAMALLVNHLLLTGW